MKKALLALTCSLGIALTTGCTFTGSTDLSRVANHAGLTNVTTGDGTFEDYTATGHYSATEFGIGVGIPIIFKLLEIYPSLSDEDLMTRTAEDAADDGANAMINAKPPKGLYTGIPFFFVGLYIDTTSATGIAVD